MGMRIAWQHGRRAACFPSQVATCTAWPAASVAIEHAGKWGARQGYNVAAGNGEAGCRPAPVKRPGNRGLAQLCHASKSGQELRDWGRVMLGLLYFLT